MAASIGERKVAALLDAADINYVKEYSFEDLNSEKGNPLRFDFAVFDDDEKLAFLIEFNGEQHYKRAFQTAQQFVRQQSNDKRKINYCRVKNIPLVIIPYTEYNSITLDQILERGKYF